MAAIGQHTAVMHEWAYFAWRFCDEWKLAGEIISREKTSRVTISSTFFSVEIGLNQGLIFEFFPMGIIP